MSIQFVPYILFAFVILLGLSASYIDDARNDYSDDYNLEISQIIEQPYEMAATID